MSLSERARALLQQGRLAEAEAAFRRVLESEPGHVESLNVLALAALRDGRAGSAVEMLERAARADAADALTRHHLGRAYEAAGDSSLALKEHESAVRLRPDFSVGRLYWAACLERTRQPDLAAIHYVRALDDAQRAGRWLNPETTPPALRPLVEHAVVAVREHRAAAFARLFEPLVERFGMDSLQRIAQTLRIYFRQETAVCPDPRQKPTFLYLPGLPASPYIERADCPWIGSLEAATAAIQSELATLLPQALGREPVFDSKELERENLRGAGVEPDWTGFYFYRHGLPREDNRLRCPATARAIELAPLCRVRDHGPEVLFSVFSPGTHLLPHRGVTNTRLVAHLPLQIPADCALKVGGEIHEWREGRVVVFDDTYEHEAWNLSHRTRVVLILDVWNPFMTEVERAAFADLVGEIGDFRESVDNA